MTTESLTTAWVPALKRHWREPPLPVPAVAAVAAATSFVTVIAIQSPAVVIGVLFALVMAVAVWRYPEIALIGLLVLLPFHSAIVTAVTTKAGAHLGRLGDWKDALIVLLFVRGVIARRARQAQLTMPRGMYPRYLIAYILFYCIVAVASPALTPAATALSRDIEGPLLFLAILCLRPSRRVLQICLVVSVSAAVVVALAAVYEHFGPKDGFLTWYGAPQPQPGSSFFGASGSYRAGSFLDSPLTLAFYLAVSAPVALGASFALRRWRMYGLLGASACVAGILMTATRSGYIGVGIGLALVLALALSNRTLRTSLVGVFLIVVAAAYFFNKNDAQLRRTGENSSKRSAITSTFDYIAANPLGAGLGTIDAVGQRFNIAGGSGTGSTSSESTILAKGYEGGAAALFLYPATMLLLIVYLLAMRRRATERDDRLQMGLAAGAVGAAGAVLGAGLFLGVQELVVEAMIWSSAGIAAAWSLAPASRLRSERGRSIDPTVGRPSIDGAEFPPPNVVLARMPDPDTTANRIGDLAAAHAEPPSVADTASAELEAPVSSTQSSQGQPAQGQEAPGAVGKPAWESPLAAVELNPAGATEGPVRIPSEASAAASRWYPVAGAVMVGVLMAIRRRRGRQ